MRLGILVYRLLRNEPKKKLKLLHAVMMMTALLLASIGLKAVFDSHNLAEPPIDNLYTLHSWIGLSAVICFALQWLFGFVSFLFPGVRHSLRASYMPLHVYGGLMIFGLATAAALMGLLEKAIFSRY
jgi:cytochrome b-561